MFKVAAGKVHFAVVTMENELYTWATAQGGAEMVGQLGHGNTAMYKAPKRVESFEGVHIKQVGGKLSFVRNTCFAYQKRKYIVTCQAHPALVKRVQ